MVNAVLSNNSSLVKSFDPITIVQNRTTHISGVNCQITNRWNAMHNLTEVRA